MTAVERTEPRRARHAERTRASLVARTLAVAGVGGWEIDLATRTLTWTEQTFRIHDLTESEYTPTLESAIGFYVGDHVPLITQAVGLAMRLGTPFDLELELTTDKGRRIWVRATAQVEFAGGQPRRVFGIVQDITERRRLEQEILEIARHDQARAGSNLHDGLGQSLTGIALMLRCLASGVRERAPDLSIDADRVTRLLGEAIGSCRELAKGLTPVSAAHGGLMTALRDFARAVSGSRNVAVRVQRRGRSGLALDERVAEHLYKIAQDAIIRAVETQRATQVAVSVSAAADQVILSVTGNGDGADPGTSDLGLDLLIIRRRARLIGAILESGPRPRGGTRVRCTVRNRPVTGASVPLP